MNWKLLVVGLFITVLSSTSIYAAHHGSDANKKPGRIDAALTTLEATVEAIDLENRKVTLKGPKGNSLMIDVDEDVKNLPQVEVGDMVTVQYLESVAIQVFSPGEVEPGAVAATAVATAKTGEKPAGLSVEKTSIVVTIEAIDMENQLVTLKNAEGESKTVKPREPENLKKVKVGDKVMITYTEAVGITVTEKMAQK